MYATIQRTRNTIKINNKIIEKIYTSKTTSTQTVKDRDDRMCELWNAFN